MWPKYFNLFTTILFSTSWSRFSDSLIFVLRILSSLVTPSMGRRHVISKTWSRFSSFFFIVYDSAPYNSIERISVWYNCILVWLLIFFDVRMLLSRWKADPLSLFWFWCHLYMTHCLQFCPLGTQSLPPALVCCYLSLCWDHTFLCYNLHFCLEAIVTAGLTDSVYKGLKFPGVSVLRTISSAYLKLFFKLFLYLKIALLVCRLLFRGHPRPWASQVQGGC